MKKFLIIFLLLVVSFVLNGLLTRPVLAAWVSGDTGIQTVHQDNVPQITNSNTIQNSYTNDSLFPLALYWVDLSTQSTVKAAGFNTIYGPNYDYTRVNPTGLRAFQDLQWTIKSSIDSNNWRILTDYVNSLKTNPAILAWQLFDETPPGTPDQMKTAYNVVKAADPARPIFANSGQGGCIDSISDIINTDYYPFGPLKTSLSTTGSVVTNLVQCPFRTGGSQIKKPVFVILQAFAGDSWVKPAPIQIRGQIYTAIAHGATGVWLFVEQSPILPGGLSGISSASTPDHWAAASKANQEITANKRIFLSKTASDIYHTYYQRNCVPSPGYCRGCGNQSNCRDFDNQGTYNCEIHSGCGYNTASGSCSGNYCQVACSTLSQTQCPQVGGCTWSDDCRDNLSSVPLHTMLKNTGETDVRYLLAVNVDYVPLDGRFTFDNYPKNIGRVTSVFDNRNVTIDAANPKAFTDNGIAAYDARLYKIEFGTIGPTTTLTPTPSYLSGDLDKNGKIDIFDYNLMIQNFGNTTCGNVADIDGNCKVDIFDYNILVGNFGK